MLRRRHPLIASLFLASCAAQAPDPVQLAGVEPREASVLATFSGEIDTGTGVVSLWQGRVGTIPALATGAPDVAYAIPEGAAAVTIVNQAGSQWNNKPMPAYCATNSTGAIVELTSNYSASTFPASTKLTNVFAEITSTTPATSGNACNPSTGAVGYAYLNQNFGAWSYGDVAEGQTKEAPWAFTWSSAVSYTFRGQIAGQRVQTTTAQGYAVSTSQSMMAGASWVTFFVDVTNNRFVCVYQDGSIKTSSVITGTITGLSAEPTGNSAFAAVSGADPRLVEIYYGCTTVDHPTPDDALGRWTPSGIAAFGNGGAYIGIAGTNYIGELSVLMEGDFWTAWNAGRPVTNPAVGTQRVGEASVGYVYFSTTSPTLFKRFEVGYKTITDVTITPAACTRSTTSLPMVTGPNGAVWFMGDGSPGQICSVTGATTTAEEALAGTLGLVYGTDSNMWADGTAGVSRLWVGAGGNHNTWLALNGVGGSGATRGGMVSGADGVWFPTVSAGTTTFTRIIP